MPLVASLQGVLFHVLASRSYADARCNRMTLPTQKAFAEAGTGSHGRRWGIVEGHVQSSKEAMFVNSIKPISDATVPLVKELVKRLEVSERQALEDLRLTFSVYWETPGIETKGARLRLLPKLVALKKTLNDVGGST